MRPLDGLNNRKQFVNFAAGKNERGREWFPWGNSLPNISHQPGALRRAWWFPNELLPSCSLFRAMLLVVLPSASLFC